MKTSWCAKGAVFLLAGLVLCWTLPALAAEKTGKINGNVYDPDGVPLAGVEVMVSSSDLMGVRKIQTSEDGGFLFFGLPPGKYTLQIDQQGFVPVKQDEIRVKLGGTATLDILMELPTAEETVVVTAKRPVVDKERTQLGQNFDDEYLESVPVGRSYQSVALLAPGVTGGGNPNVHGGSLYENQYLVDGINVTDPATNTFSANINYDAIKEFQILTGGLDAEYGQATGGIINVVTQSGSNEFHIDGSVWLAPDLFRLRDKWEEEAVGVDDSYSFNLNVGGPILKDKLWYFASLEFNYATSSIAPTQDFFDPTNPDLVGHPARKWLSVFYLAKLTYQMTDKHKLTFHTMGDPTIIENADQSSTTAPEAELDFKQGGNFSSISWEAIWTKNLFQRSVIGLGYQDMADYPHGDCRDTQDEACAARYDSATGLSSNNYGRDVKDHRYRLQVDSVWTYYLDNLLGDHEIKAGWNYTHSWTDFTYRIPGGASFNDQNGRPYRKTITIFDEGQDSWTTDTQGNIMGLFLQDSWKIFDNLIFKPGLRIDWLEMIDFKDTQVTEAWTTSPRINLVWDITGDGKTVFRAGYNRYVAPSWFNVSRFVSDRPLKSETYEYNPETGRYDIFFQATGGEENVVRGPNETAPHTDELSLQVERELFTDFSLALNGVYREYKYLYEDDEVNEIYNQEGSNVIGYKNGEETYIYRSGNPREAWRRYWGMELVARKELSDNWQMYGSYTYSRSEGAPDTYWTMYLDNPRQSEYYWSWTAWDRRHVLKLNGSYLFPYGIQVGYDVQWMSGLPYSKWFKDDQYGAYILLQAPRNTDPDHPDNDQWNRTPDIFMMDLRVAWNLKELTGHDMSVVADLFNVMHLRYKTDLETQALPDGSDRQYGQFYGMSDGFWMQLGFRYRY